MVDIFAIERALLVNIVKNKNWDLLILNDITEKYFTEANKPMYRYIKEFIGTDNNYPDLQILSFTFEINDDDMASYLSITDLQSLCDTVKNEYLKEELKYQITQLNTKSQDMYKNPIAYIDSIGKVYNDLKVMGFKNKTVDLFDSIEEVLTIDPTDVISTGFKELDEKLIGWKRGEELVVLVGRPGQGKSFLGLKLAFAAMMQGERVGIYSGEMSKLQLQERALCCAKQNYTDTKEDALKYIKEKDLHLKILTFNELRRKANVNDIEEMIVRDKLSMVVVDQLSLMEDVDWVKGTPLRLQYNNITSDLFSISQKYGVAIILLVQSNRQGAESLYGPQLENIAESDAVAQNATRVITLRKEGDLLTLNIVKNRYGESGLVQRYEVDYGINKYRPLKDNPLNFEQIKRPKPKDLFGRNSF